MMNLGELISAFRRKDPSANVWFDFGYFRPTYMMSWRGDYKHLALGYSNEFTGEDITVEKMLKILEDAVGKKFTGHNAREHAMGQRTPVWVANSNEACHTVILCVRKIHDFVIIKTGYQSY